MITNEEAQAKLDKGEKLGRQDAIDLLRLQVAKKPDGYVYINNKGLSAALGVVDCANLHSVDKGYTDLADESYDGMGKEGVHVPGCIVGSVFAALVGLTRTPIAGDADSTNDETGRPFDYEAVKLLSSVQQQQDRGWPWADAVKSVV